MKLKLKMTNGWTNTETVLAKKGHDMRTRHLNNKSFIARSEHIRIETTVCTSVGWLAVMLGMMFLAFIII